MASALFGFATQSAAIAFTFTAVFATLVYVLYQALWHPLAKYPGPFLAKFTNLYAAYHGWTGDIHIDIRRCHDKYGEHVRYAPDRLLFDNVNAVNDIYGHKSKGTKSQNYTVLAHKAPNTLTLRDKAEHSRRRRIMSQGFSDSALRGFEQPILTIAENLIGRLRQGCLENGGVSQAIDMSQMFDHFAFDAMSKLIFSASHDTIGSETWRHIMPAIAASNVRMSALLQAPELKTGKIDKWLFPEAIVSRNRFVKFVAHTLRQRLALEKKERQDIFSYLQAAKDPSTGKGFSMSELSAETATLIVAGSDTSSTAMAGCLFYLAMNPKAYSAVTKEIRETFVDAAAITSGARLSSCHYLRACIDETLRLSPPAGGPLWREVAPEGAVIDGIFVPPGVDVGVGVYSIHHNARYFPNPYAFLPERWMQKECNGRSTTSDERQTSARCAYMPFSLGPRSCIGKSLALVELRIVLARILFELDFSLALEGAAELGLGKGEFKLKDHITGEKPELMMRFRPRLGL